MHMQFVVMDNSTASDGDTLECSLDLPFSSCACFLSSEVKLIIVPYRILGEINMSMFIKCLEQWLTHGACFVSVGQYCINNMAIDLQRWFWVALVYMWTDIIPVLNMEGYGLPRWPGGKESACQCRGRGFNPWVVKVPRSRKWQPTPVFLPGKFHGQRSLAGLQSMRLQSWTWLSTCTHTHMHTHITAMYVTKGIW